ncbi:MAG: Ig-like domain-containing protein, partial [Oscillospiraceae bacterium]|nr:Ig-like domain-containing protein [Oscillospiraceae bacterium]
MRKVISMLLVMCILLGLMPTIALGAEGDSFDVTFLDLKEGCYLANATAGSNWKVDTAKSGKVMVNGTKYASRWQVAATYAFLQIPQARGDLALKFTAPSAGTYDIIVHHQPYATGPNLDLYINDIYVGTVDGKDANGSHTIVREQKIAGVTLKAGEYANSIVMRASSGKFNFQGITFVETTSPASISKIEAEVDNKEMFVGTTQQINVSALLTNEGSYDIAKGAEKIEYDVSDPSVATVSDDGVLSAVGDGSATVTVTATVNTKPYPASFDIIAKVPVINEVFVTAPRYILLDDTEGEALEVSAKLTDGADVDMSTATITYTAQNECARVTENGVVIPVSEGIAQILVRVTTPDNEFKEKTVEIPISKEVIYPSFEIYFNEEYAWDKVTSDGYFTADTHGSNWTLNKALTADVFYGGSTNAARIQKGIVEYIYLKNYGDFAVDFTVPESGYYDLTAEAIQYTSSGLAKFYIDGKYVGEYDTYAKPGDIYTAVPKKLRSLYLEEGKAHTLLIRNGGKTSGGTNLFIRSVRFEGRASLDGISKVEIEKGRSTYAAVESDDYNIRVTQNNVAVYYLPLVS